MPTQATVFAQLETALADMYLDEKSATRVARTAGMDVSRIAFKERAIDNWHEIVLEANRQAKLPELLQVAEKEYPAYGPLRDALTTYREWLAAGRAVQPPTPAPPAVKPVAATAAAPRPAAPRSRRWVVWLGVMAVGLFVAIGAYLLGPKTVTVPSVRGQDYATASQLLREAGFQVGENGQPNLEIDRGYAIGTIPPAGSQVARGSEVILVISTGATIVPSVEGFEINEARQQIVLAGLNAILDKEYSDTIPAERIIRTAPPAGTPMLPAQPVTLFVSLGPPPVAPSPKIAFSAQGTDDELDIHLTNVDGSGTPVNLTNHWSRDAHPTWSPDGQRLAFETNRDGASEIYAMDADGTRLANLTNHTANDTSPAWSPDGRLIAFSSDRDGNFEMYLMNADGSRPRRLTNFTTVMRGPPDALNAAWSPDGRSIAVQVDRNNRSTLFAVNADGSGVPLQLTAMTGIDWWPAWSPDGNWIAFASPVRNEKAGIYRMDPSGGSVQGIFTTADTATAPDWSPDGTRISFSHYAAGPETSEIYVVNDDGSGLIKLIVGYADAGEPAWQPQ